MNITLDEQMFSLKHVINVYQTFKKNNKKIERINSANGHFVFPHHWEGFIDTNQ